ncbi:MAG: choice-of-anchor Q domain-containing protein [Pseudomonadota bacterium]
MGDRTGGTRGWQHAGERRSRMPGGALLLLLACLPAEGRAQSFCEPVADERLAAPIVLGDGTPGSVTTADIQAALDAGGPITFDVGPDPVTIVVTDTLIASGPTVFDGGGGVTLSGGGETQIMRVINPNPSPDAPRFTVTLQNIGLIDSVTTGGRGGAIYKEHDFEFPYKVSLKLVNCHLAGNSAPLDGTTQDDGGGGLYVELLDRVDIGNCVFEDNEGSNGGAFYSLGSLTINVVDSVFRDNRAIGRDGNPGNGGNAGAFGVDGGERTVDICRTRFEDNTANAFGAGFFSVMYDTASRTRFEDTVFLRNLQVDAGQHTGGAYIQGGPWAMDRVSFIDNEARGFGGLSVFGNAPGSIVNGTFSGNIARTGLGGAMALTSSAPITIVNTTIANNEATDAFAAGIAIGAPNQLTLTNTIFANNSGGNIFVNWAMNNPASASGGGNFQWPPTRPANGGAETPVTADVDFEDPLVPTGPASNGGFVPTLALDAASPAVDGGVSGPDVPTTDARGQARVGAVDAGAYELDPMQVVFRNGFEPSLPGS